MMRTSSAAFLTFAVLFSFSLRSLGSPLPEEVSSTQQQNSNGALEKLTTTLLSQTSAFGNEAAPLGTEDDPARLRRYLSYGLKQTKLQGVFQPGSNSHQDATAFANSAPGQMTAAPAGVAQSNTDAGALYGGTRITGRASEVPVGVGSSQTGGMTGFSNGATNQYGPTYFGRDVSDTAKVVGAGEQSMTVQETTMRTAEGLRGLSASGGIHGTSRVKLQSQELVDHAIRDSDPSNGPGAASSPFGTGVGSASSAEMGFARQTMSEPERQVAQGAYSPFGKQGVSTLAQSSLVYNGEKVPSVARVAENGIATHSQSTQAFGASSRDGASGLYAEHQGAGMYIGSSSQTGYGTEGEMPLTSK